MAVVDFEAGGCSSVTFSPDTGAVIRERKVREAPRKVEGAYIQPLPTVPPSRPFHGFMGLYLHRGRLAFFRRCEQERAEGQPPTPTTAASDTSISSPSQDSAMSNSPPARAPRPSFRSRRGDLGKQQPEFAPWETTGFVSDLEWAEGRRLTPCLAFRDEGDYRVRVVAVGATPPISAEKAATTGSERTTTAAGGSSWSGFDWEVGPTV
eukprot:TRINITY_DN89572_c0_g1_i1.p1 TRINITY_DN89572_c0_g1~~TRINITY_DN89572_c0_g1_i1.p1  ORF type:complete len:220 (+),score=37.20 TRINITY_DN89572_c0_g1_i1:38-661(+)